MPAQAAFRGQVGPARVEMGDAMQDIENMLRDMMLSNGWSKNTLNTEVRERGICLRNGKEYGPALPAMLKRNRKLVVSKEKAKQYPLAKKCLVATGAH